MDTQNSVQKRVDSVYAVMEYVGARCPRLYDADMEERFDAVLESVESSESETRARPSSKLYNSSLGRNYSIAQLSVLLAFSNRIGAVAASDEDPRLKVLIDQLWQELELTYRQFFDSEAPAR